MPGDVSCHRLIARPPGLPGYAPDRWCAVCGKKTASKSVVHCSVEHCPNIVHTNCLDEQTTFDCGKVSTLRVAQEISAPVVFLEAAADPPQGEADTTELLIADEDDYDELLQLDTSSLVNIIRELRMELRRKKSILGFFDTTSQRISQQRDAVVTILDFIDNIAATKSCLDDLDTRTIATSAKPEWIDHQWQQHIATNQTSQVWWMTDKPRLLRTNAKQNRRAVNGTQVSSPSPAVSPDRPTTRAPPAASPEHQAPRTLTATRPMRRGTRSSPTTSPERLTARTVPPSSPVRRAARVPPAPSPERRATRGPHVTSQHVTSQHPATDRRRAPASSAPVARTQTQSRSYCNHCGRSGHTENTCFRKDKCEFCQRYGHTIQECRTRLDYDRQENFFRQLSVEQARNNAWLLQSLTKTFVHPSLNQNTPQVGSWAPPQVFQPHRYDAQHHYAPWNYPDPHASFR